jgi:putative NADH-flavin reductase
MQVTIFGASGKVGSLVVKDALRRGYDVVAFVHSHNPFLSSGQLTVVKGDIYNANDVAEVVRGSGAVISCLGSWGTPQHNVLSSAMERIIPAMTEQRVKRLVTLTGIGVREHPGWLVRTTLRLVSGLPVGKVFLDAQKHLQLLGQSSLDWTVICSPVMNNMGGDEYHLSLRTGLPLVTVSRTSVAAGLLDQIEATDYVCKTPVIHRGTSKRV